MQRNDRSTTQTEEGTPSDEHLALLATRGERSALSILVERYHAPLLGYLYRVVDGDRALAEDLVQETFVRLMKQASYQAGRPFKPWLYTIATNLARDHFRSPASRQIESIEAEGHRELPDPSHGPEAASQSADQGAVVAEAIRQLGPEYRTVLLLRYYQNLSLHEIAAVLNLPPGTVKSRLSVGTRRLRDLLTARKGEL